MLRYLLIKRLQRAQRITPRVSFIGHKSLQNALRHLLSVSRVILEPSGERRHVRERGFLRKELADLQVRVDAFLYPAENFQNQMASVDDRGVALLCTHGFGLQAARR